jgi:23S rRNA pseudouridine1911/1915/1917 synthase
MQISIIFEDQDLVVINKPAGVVVNKADSIKGFTIQDWMIDHFPELQAVEKNKTDWQIMVPADFNLEFGTPEQVFAERQGIVHRLDKDTSGVLVLAKNPGSLVNLLAQFKNREVSKEYLCLVHGKFNLNQGTVALPLGRSSRDRRHFAVDLEGRVAVTEYRVEKWYSSLDTSQINTQIEKKYLGVYQQGFSLVSCMPKTGRTHQIRVHLSAIQHPLVGDITYVGRKRAKLDPVWCPRQFLHAAQIRFKHPRTGEALSFSAELSPDLAQVLAYLI